MQTIKNDLKNTLINFNYGTISSYDNNVILEFEDLYNKYVIRINENKLNLLSDLIKIIKRLSIIYVNQEQINDIKRKNSLLKGLYELTKQHLHIYQSSDKIYDSFIEQAGTYEQVEITYKKLSVAYDENIKEPISLLQKQIDECNQLTKVDLETMGIRTDFTLSFEKSTIEISI